MQTNNEIKQYPSLFATKMNHVLDLSQIAPLQHGRAKAIEHLTNEKDSTVNNWLFNGKIPRENKKLSIADAIGVSLDYLFDDTENVNSIRKPEIYHDGQCYLVPYIDENDIFELKRKDIFVIKNRLPIMFPGFDLFIQKYGKHVYITRMNEGIFEPHVQKNSDIIYSENVIFEDFRLVIHFDTQQQKSVVKRVIVENDQYYLEFMNDKQILIKEPLKKNEEYVSIVLTYST